MTEDRHVVAAVVTWGREVLISMRLDGRPPWSFVYVGAQAASRADVVPLDRSGLIEVRWATLNEAEALMPGLHSPVRDYLARELRQR